MGLLSNPPHKRSYLFIFAESAVWLLLLTPCYPCYVSECQPRMSIAEDLVEWFIAGALLELLIDPA